MTSENPSPFSALSSGKTNFTQKPFYSFQINKSFRNLVCLSLIIILITSCKGFYTLNGHTISDDIKTYYVDNFKLTALNAPATINQTFVESLKDKISKESRLKYTDENPHLEFNGTIQGYNVTSVAPQPGETTAFNRLTISLTVEYTNNLNPKDKWTKSFSHFEDFPSETNLLQVQDELIDVIFKQILEDIFNQAFNNW